MFEINVYRNKNCLWWPCLLMDRDKMSNLYRGPSIDASYKFRFICQSGFRGEDFQKSTNQKQELSVAAMFVNGSGRNVQSYNRGPSIDASYQVSVHLAKRFQRRRFFRNQPIRNKNCLWRPCLLTDRDEMCNLITEDLPQMLPTKIQFIWPYGFRGAEF